MSPFEIEHGLPMRLPIDLVDLSWQTEDNAKLGLHAADWAPYPALNRKEDTETLEFEPAERIRAIHQFANEQLYSMPTVFTGIRAGPYACEDTEPKKYGLLRTFWTILSVSLLLVSARGP